MNIPREKIVRWHPEFDVESCKKIEQAVLPQPPYVEKPTAKDVLGKSYNIDDNNKNFMRKNFFAISLLLLQKAIKTVIIIYIHNVRREFQVS